jgi:hypothetical protein
MPKFDSLLAESAYLMETVEMLDRLVDRLGGAGTSDWKTPYDNTTLVDLDNLVWIKAEFPDAITYTANPICDWITLWNPGTINLLREVFISHLRSLGEMGLVLVDRGLPPETLDSLRVSPAIMKLAQRLREYPIQDERVADDGEVLSPPRKLEDL